MLITYALEILAETPDIDEIQIVADIKWREDILTDAEARGIPVGKIKGFAQPGATRQMSVVNGMQAVLQRRGQMAGTGDRLVIHDAARPLVTSGLLQECIKQAESHDGAMPVLPMRDTVYLSRDGKSVSELLERNQIFAGQAPEVFDFKKYYEANLKLFPHKILQINGSTEPAVMAGMDVVMIPGDENNFKITTPADLERFRRVLRAGPEMPDGGTDGVR